LTTAAYLQDSRDPRAREQFAKQAQKESEFRNAPFTPKRANDSAANGGADTAGLSSNSDAGVGAPAAEPPEAFTRNCAKCHGPHAEGKSIYPSLVGVSAKPRRTVEDIVAILNDPRSYGLEPRMPSFAKKLSDEDKSSVAEWIASLK
jgi:mono/diheme cytochrome c family protein